MNWQQHRVPNIPIELTNLFVEHSLDTCFLPALYNRGIHTVEDLSFLISGTLLDTTPSTRFGESIYKAVSRIKQAIRNNQHIVVFGDYDADGTTGTALVISVLKKLKEKHGYGFTYDYIIPNRFTEGYGLNDKTLPRLLAKKPNLVITVDCGIASAKQVTALKQMGIDTIVTDHHQPQDELPTDAFAIVHPLLSTDYPFPDLSGCGVAYQLMKGLWETQSRQAPNWVVYDQLDLVAVAAVCDVMPLKRDNRIYVKEGLKLLNKGNRLAFRLMKQKLGLKTITTYTLGFDIGPRINAAGRMSDADIVVECLISDDVSKCTEILDILEERNKQRKHEQIQIIEHGMQKIDKGDFKHLSVLVGDYHEGVIGLAAGKLAEKLYRPAFVLSHVDETKLKGSARSIPNVHLFQLMKKYHMYLDHWGGHAMAAGFAIHKDNVQTFFQALDDELSKYPAQTWTRTQYWDIEISSDGFTSQFFRTLDILEPFGTGFSPIVWKMKGVVNDGERISTGGRKGTIRIGDQTFSFVMWADAPHVIMYQPQTFYGNWSWNHRQGMRQLNIIDAEPTARPTITLNFSALQT